MSTPHITKADLQTDAVTMELKKGFQWTQAHSKATLTAVVIFIAAGLGYSGWKYMSEKKAASTQDVYFKVEQDYLKLKTKAMGTGMEAKPVTLDYDKDLAEIVKKFNGVVDNDPSSTAAVMAALNVAEIASQYHKEEMALATINKVRTGSNLISAMLLNSKATLQANMNDCKSAIETWTKLLSLSAASPIKSQALLKQALCYESTNENTKAEENYNKVMAESKDGALAKTAEKYLRQLKSKMN